MWTCEGQLYLANVKYIYTKELVSYAINKCMTAELVCRTLNMIIIRASSDINCKLSRQDMATALIARNLGDRINLSNTDMLCADKGSNSDTLREHIKQVSSFDIIHRNQNTKSYALGFTQSLPLI